MSSAPKKHGPVGSAAVQTAQPVPEQPGADGNGRKLDREGTRREILEAARTEFAEKGFSGARVDEISARTRTAKRMIYYYFGSKDGLYMATLEHVFADIRAAEAALDLENLSPREALARLVDFTFDYHEAHKDFVRILAGENMNDARYLKQSERIRELNSNVLESLSRILVRGRQDGSFCRPVEPVDLYMMISGLCFFRVSNRPTFSEVFGVDLSAEPIAIRQKRMIREAVLNFVGNDRATR
jgi:AcrR family transcriptional regulator